ncbi:putative immunity protein [Nocardia thraciensis]
MNAAGENPTIELGMEELREVAGYAAACAEPALAIFERDCPGDRRPRAAIEAAREFAEGARRSKAIRDAAWAAQRAYGEARDAGQAAASEVARAAVAACGAAYLHPLAKATQVLHIVGAAAHAARAFELNAGDDHSVGYIEKATGSVRAAVVRVLVRYPPAPRGRGRVGELARELDSALRRWGIPAKVCRK